MKLKILFLISVIYFTTNLYSQIVYEHISNTAIYTFLDELSVDGAIVLNKATKPYSRTFIAEKLLEAESNSSKLTIRQQKEIAFYLQSFRIDTSEPLAPKLGVLDLLPEANWATSLDPMAGFYKDTFVTFSLKPIIGSQIWNNENGNNFHRWSGVDAYGYMGKHLAFYGSLRDNIESEWMAKPTYLVREMGVPVKPNYAGEIGQVAYTEMRGGLTYQWNWGDVSLVKDHVEWGINYAGSNIFSGRTPSFAMLKFNLNPVKWFEFNFYHGWLASAEVDSSRSYFGNPQTIRDVFYEKNIAANLFSFKPWSHTRFSFGNSIVYSDMGTHPAYLNPFMFYKSIDHTYQSTGDIINNDAGQNAQMYAEVSTKVVPYFHFYASLYIDEISMSKVTDPDLNTNLLSYKLGLKSYNLLPNVSFTFEYTKNRPMVYAHYIRTTTFASNKYSLGHYLGENAQEIYGDISWKPIRGLYFQMNYTLAQKGPELLNDANFNRGLPFMESVEWEKKELCFKASYEIFNNAYLFGYYSVSSISGNAKYNTPYFNGDTKTLSLGLTNNF